MPPEENNPPTQSGEPVLRVGQDGLASIKVLPYFKDPDGDDLFLSNAGTADPRDEVRFPPGREDRVPGRRYGDGAQDRGHHGVRRGGRARRGQAHVDVVASNVPPVAVQDHVTVLAGEPITVDPLKNDYDPNADELR